jgi:hypothetical protein
LAGIVILRTLGARQNDCAYMYKRIYIKT